MEHFPLFFNNTWKFSVMDAWRYVNLFPKHKITSKRINTYSLSTNHIYDDRLIFQLNWNVTNFNEVLSAFPSIMEISRFFEHDHITLNSYTLVSYSAQDSEAPTHEARELFLKEFGLKQRQIPHDEYEVLEVNERIKVSITDEEIHSLVNNYKCFEDYLKKTGRM